MNGVELIAAERRRQIDKEGWTDEHDEGHEYGELAQAGACYAQDVSEHTFPKDMEPMAKDGDNENRLDGPENWPWDIDWWRPTLDDPIRQLTKAGALIAAEIDRLQRQS